MSDKYVVDKWEGNQLKYNVGNRIAGLIKVGFGTFIATTTDNTFLDIAAIPLVIDGIGDLVTGKHHYLSSRLFKFHPKYE